MLREIVEADLPIFYEHQRDPRGCKMAAFKPRELDAFMTHWKTKILSVPTALMRTIVHESKVAGYVGSYASGADRLACYWIGREFWGLGLATAALNEFVQHVDRHRPLDAFVATRNVGSIRVLEKAGFKL